nr:MAG TPA: hypothetical protein [Caudoviricetes sp.]
MVNYTCFLKMRLLPSISFCMVFNKKCSGLFLGLFHPCCTPVKIKIVFN